MAARLGIGNDAVAMDIATGEVVTGPNTSHTGADILRFFTHLGRAPDARDYL